MSPMNPQEQQELQQMVLEMNMLDAQFKEMQQQMTLIEQQAAELQVLENNINEIEKLGKKKEKDCESLSQIGQGIFVKSTLKDTNEIFVNIGSKIVLKKSPEEAKQFVKKRSDQVMNVRDLVMQELNKMVMNIQLLEKQIQEKAKANQI